MANKLFHSIKDYVFPVFCLVCEREGEWLCKKCLLNISTAGVFCCPVCHKKTDLGVTCESCLSQSFLDAHLAVYPYVENGLVGKVIHALKYEFAEDLVEVIEKLIINFCEENRQIFSNFDFIIPIPLHKRREVERGFNQARKIALLLSKITDLPVQKGLVRVCNTKQQAKLKRQERLINLRDVFKIYCNRDLVGSRVLLVDDVFTTGATMQEAAKVLKKTGIKYVLGFSLARG